MAETKKNLIWNPKNQEVIIQAQSPGRRGYQILYAGA